MFPARTPSATRIGTATSARTNPSPWLMVLAISSFDMRRPLYTDFRGLTRILCYCSRLNGFTLRAPPVVAACIADGSNRAADRQSRYLSKNKKETRSARSRTRWTARCRRVCTTRTCPSAATTTTRAGNSITATTADNSRTATTTATAACVAAREIARCFRARILDRASRSWLGCGRADPLRHCVLPEVRIRQSLDRRAGPSLDRHHVWHRDVARRFPIPATRLAHLFSDPDGRRHRAALPFDLRCVRLLPSRRTEDGFCFPRDPDCRSRRARARLQRPRNRDHGVDWRATDARPASLRSRSVSIVLYLSRRA